MQKAYSYLKMGEVNYTTLKKYPIAQKYYDSCLVFLPKNHPDYKSIELRSKVLDEFVEQLTIIETGDSLLKLAAMSESSLDKFLDEEIARDIEKQKIAYEYAKKQKKEKEDKEQQIALANGGNTNGGGTNAGDPNAKWYFYNTQLVTLGKAAFDTKWGMRPLEDNWRRSQKETEMSNPNDGTSSAQVANDDSKNAYNEVYRLASVDFKAKLDALNVETILIPVLFRRWVLSKREMINCTAIRLLSDRQRHHLGTIISY